MGIETALIISAVAAVAAAGATVAGAQAQSRAEKKASGERNRARLEQKEAQEVQTAAEKSKQISEQRRAIRESRVRLARIAQSSQNSGVYGSSGQVGAEGIVNTNLGDAVATSRGIGTAVQGINAANQRAADHLSNANNAISQGNIQANMWNAFSNVASTASTVAGGVGEFMQTKNNANLYNTSTGSNGASQSRFRDGTIINWS